MLKTIALLVATMTTASASDSMLRGIVKSDNSDIPYSKLQIMKVQKPWAFYTLAQRVTNLEKMMGSLHFPQHFGTKEEEDLNRVNSPWFLPTNDPDYRPYDPTIDDEKYHPEMIGRRL